MGSAYRALLVDHKEALEPIFAFGIQLIAVHASALVARIDAYAKIKG